MKLFVYDMGWMGAYMVMAESKEQAAKLTEEQEGHASDLSEWVEYDPTKVVRVYGDM